MFNSILTTLIYSTYGKASQLLDGVVVQATESDDLITAVIDGFAAGTVKFWKTMFDYGVPAMSEAVKAIFSDTYDYFVDLNGSGS